MKRRGLSLITVLTFIGFWLVLFLAIQNGIGSFRHRVSQARYREQARAMAFSGLEYVRATGWKGSTYRSPDLGGGWFELRRESNRIVSRGCAGPARVERTE